MVLHYHLLNTILLLRPQQPIPETLKSLKNTRINDTHIYKADFKTLKVILQYIYKFCSFVVDVQFKFSDHKVIKHNIVCEQNKDLKKN